MGCVFLGGGKKKDSNTESIQLDVGQHGNKRVRTESSTAYLPRGMLDLGSASRSLRPILVSCGVISSLRSWSTIYLLISACSRKDGSGNK